MTEAERTPGPWHIMEGTDWVIVSPEVSVAAVYTPRGVREVRQANGPPHRCCAGHAGGARRTDP